VSLVFWDTMLFIYWIEEHPRYAEQVDRLRERMWKRKDQLCTSALTVGEILSGTSARNNRDLAIRYAELLSPPLVQVLPFTIETARIFANIRADKSIEVADAIQLACASEAKVDLLLTNDRRLAKKTIPGIQFIADLNFDYL
jgi:predicted nucleic acid-binding protein